MNLNILLEATTRRLPEKEAIIDGERRISYRELLAASRRAATVFAEAGVRKGDRVAVMALNSPEFIIAAFGIWRAGGVLVPINHKLQVPEVRFTIKHCGARVGVASQRFADVVSAAAPGTQWLMTGGENGAFEAAVAAAAESEGATVSGDDDAEILYVSTAAGDPKACLHTHRAISAVPPLVAAALPLDRHDRFLIAMPLWHSSPLNDWLLTTIFLGATVVLMAEYDPIRFLEAVQTYKATAFFGAPIAFLAPLKVLRAKGRKLSDFDLSSVNKWIYGGVPASEHTARLLMEVYHTDHFYQGYALSETGPAGSILYPDEQAAHAGSVGRGGMPGVGLRVVKPDGTDAAAGETGEVWIRADTCMRGYLDNPATTAATLVGSWCRTGDLARIDKDGYLFIVGRSKDMLIVSGENVYSLEVEEPLREHPRIADVAVVGRTDPEWGEKVVAVVVTRDGKELTIEDIREFLSDRIARYKLPREVIRVDALPRNAQGAIDKQQIRATLL